MNLWEQCAIRTCSHCFSHPDMGRYSASFRCSWCSCCLDHDVIGCPLQCVLLMAVLPRSRRDQAAASVCGFDAHVAQITPWPGLQAKDQLLVERRASMSAEAVPAYEVQPVSGAPLPSPPMVPVCAEGSERCSSSAAAGCYSAGCAERPAALVVAPLALLALLALLCSVLSARLPATRRCLPRASGLAAGTPVLHPPAAARVCHVCQHVHHCGTCPESAVPRG